MEKVSFIMKLKAGIKLYIVYKRKLKMAKRKEKLKPKRKRSTVYKKEILMKSIKTLDRLYMNIRYRQMVQFRKDILNASSRK